MSAARWAAVRAAAEAVLAAPPGERARLLDERCGDDAELRAAVEAQVRACEEIEAGGGLLDTPAAAFAAPLLAVPPPERALSAALTAALAGRYAIVRELARGGSAAVYLADDLRHERRVAIKVVDPSLGRSLSAERFLREIRVTAGLTHPHILPLHDSGEAAGLLFYVMPYVEGETLRERLAREGPLDAEATIRLVREVAGALDHAHRHGIVHRDVKPANILLADGHAIVADFGIARAVREAREGGPAEGTGATRDGAAHVTLTDAGVSPGTPAYMAPEQVRGGDVVDARADLYALGLVAYQAATGMHPFARHDAPAMLAAHLGETPRPLAEAAPALPPAFAALVMRLLEKDPADRPASAQEVLTALGGSRAAAAGGRATPSRRVVAAIAGLLLLAAAAGAVALRPEPREARAARQQAYDLYLQARYHWLRRGTDNVVRAIEYYHRALAADSTFAPAHAGLAMAYVVLPIYVADSADSTTGLMLRHGRRAIALDSTLADAHLAVAAGLDGLLRYEQAEASYRRAVALEPGSSNVRHVYGMALLHRGRTEEAIAELRRAVNLDPMAVMPSTGLAGALLFARRFDEAAEVARRTLALDSAAPFARFSLGLAQVLAGDAAAGVRTFETYDALDARHAGALVLAYAAAGDWERAAAKRAALRATPAWGSLATEIADLVFGDVEPMVRAFASGKRQRELITAGTIFGCNPLLDPAWSDPRFREAMARTGIPPCEHARAWPLARSH